jgi:hypothetical protein
LPSTAKFQGATVQIISEDQKRGVAKVKMTVGEKTVPIKDLKDAKPASTQWQPMYIGEGDINDRANDKEHCECARKKGATHVHVHLGPIEQDRLAEERDLLDGYPEAYKPTGCNEKKGG